MFSPHVCRVMLTLMLGNGVSAVVKRKPRQAQVPALAPRLIKSRFPYNPRISPPTYGIKPFAPTYQHPTIDHKTKPRPLLTLSSPLLSQRPNQPTNPKQSSRSSSAALLALRERSLWWPNYTRSRLSTGILLHVPICSMRSIWDEALANSRILGVLAAGGCGGWVWVALASEARGLSIVR